jgi:hypothetical protein
VTSGVIETTVRIGDAEGDDSSDVVAFGAAWEARPTSASSASAGANAVEHRGPTSRATCPTDRTTRTNGLDRCFSPRPAFGGADATYFPMPWILSSRGYGLVVANDETAVHHLATERADAGA